MIVALNGRARFSWVVGVFISLLNGRAVCAAPNRPVVIVAPTLTVQDPFRGHTYAVEVVLAGVTEQLLVRACRDLDGIRGASMLRVASGGSLDGLRAIAEECRVLSIVVGLQPSRVTFMPDELPVRLVRRAMLCEWIDVAFCNLQKTKPAALSWQQSRSNVVIITGEQGWYASVRLVARGDFNGDRVEDVILDVGVSDDGGKSGTSAVLVLTKRRANSPVEILERRAGDALGLSGGK